MGLSANATAICDLDAEIRDLQILRNSKLPFFHLPLEICVFIFSLACHHGRLPEKRGERTAGNDAFCHQQRLSCLVCYGTLYAQAMEFHFTPRPSDSKGNRDTSKTPRSMVMPRTITAIIYHDER